MDPTPEQLRDYAQGTLDLKDLEAELGATRKRGYSVSHQRTLSRCAVAVAVPFFDRQSQVAGSIGVFGPEVRMDAARRKQIAGLLQQESSRLSEALGFGSVVDRRAASSCVRYTDMRSGI